MSAFQAFLVRLLILKWPLVSGCAFLLKSVVRAVQISGRQGQLIRKYKTIPGHLRGRLRSSSWVGLTMWGTDLNAVLSRAVRSRTRLLTCYAAFSYSDAESHCVRFLDTSQWEVSRLAIMFSRFSLDRRGVLCVHVRGIDLTSHNWLELDAHLSMS
jgi:hypothetical protein